MKRYPKYKPFGNYWISEIPSHWNEQKIKHLFDERVEKGHPDEPLLAATQNQGVILKSDYESRTVEATKDLHLLKFVKEGDFVISLRSFQGGIEYSYCQGIISPAYTIMIPRSEIDSSYFRHLAKSRTFIELLKGCVTGIREGQNINYALLRTYLLPLPPIEEQKIIADFLDKKTKQIDRFISLQKEAISLLKELRQAEITKAVTKGLDENAEMNEGWNLMKLKHCVSICNGRDYSNVQVTDGGYPVIGSGGEFARASEYLYDKSSVLFGRKGTIDKPLFQENPFWTVDTMFYTIINLNYLIPKYLYYFATTIDFPYYMTNTALPSMTKSDLENIYLNLPSLTEQENIIDYLDKKCAEIDSAIQNKEALIEKVTEYKIRLISDAVTGKIDVRGEDIKPEL